MSSNHILKGQFGEEIACSYLLSLGYQILKKNWRFSKAEVDIIAMDKDILVFVEVKTRSYSYFGKPEEFVSAHKERLYFDAANVFMEKVNYEGELRFDIIGVLIGQDNKPMIDHYEDAFFPGI